MGKDLEVSFRSIAKTVMPLVKSGAKAVGKKVLKSGVQFVSDVMGEKNVKQAAIDRVNAAGSNLFQKVMRSTPAKRQRKTPARIQKKKRQKHQDIFS